MIEKRSILRIFRIGQVITEFTYEVDFRREFDHIDGAVGANLDERVRTNSISILRRSA